jgi:hypothetical protein
LRKKKLGNRTWDTIEEKRGNQSVAEKKPIARKKRKGMEFVEQAGDDAELAAVKNQKKLGMEFVDRLEDCLPVAR